MGAPIFYLGDPRIRIMGMRPVLIRSFVLAPAIELGQILSRGSLNPGGLGQFSQKLLITLCCVALHNRAQRRVDNPPVIA